MIREFLIRKANRYWGLDGMRVAYRVLHPIRVIRGIIDGFMHRNLDRAAHDEAYRICSGKNGSLYSMEWGAWMWGYKLWRRGDATK